MDDDNFDPDAIGADGQPNWRRKLEADAKAGREARQALEQEKANSLKLQQENAMRRAGIDYESPLAQMYVKANPAVVDVEQIQTQWAEIAPGAQQQSGYNPADLNALGRVGQAAYGGGASGGAAPNFEAELDAIPYLVEGRINPNYQQEVLAATARQAARDGREFSVNGGGATKWMNGPANVPATTPLKH